jgi:hypothetical protein
VKCWQITVGTADVTGVDFGNYIQVTGTKYYSLNGADGGSTVPNWPITVTCDATATANLYCLNGGLNTDANGNYLFIPTGPVASYTVCEGGEPNWVQTYPTVPLAVNGANATACTMTSAGWAGVLGTATGSGLDFGNYATVSGTKYYSGTSTGLQGWTITLNPGGATAVTGANGKYTITVPSFPFSNGSVCETLQAGWTESSPSPSSNGGCYSYGLTAIAPTVTPVASSLDFYNEILLSGLKFYDLNLDQIQDNGEPGIGSFKIALYSCLGTGCTPGVTPAYAYTAVDGTFTWAAPGPITNYKVCEVLPATGNWTEITMPSCYLGTVGAANQTALNFGNVCEGTVNPYTQGFWQNKNGTAMLTSALNYPGWAQSMNSFNNNTDAGWSGYLSFVPTTTTKYGMKWFLAIAGSSNASKDDTEISSGLFTTTSGTNAANMLSSQLATMELNTLITNGVGGNPAPNVNNTAFMKVGTAATLTANGCNPASLPSLNAAGYATILDVETYGNTLLLFSANTTASGPARSCQVLIQTALNSANNNQALSIIQPTSCKVPTY